MDSTGSLSADEGKVMAVRSPRATAVAAADTCNASHTHSAFREVHPDEALEPDQLTHLQLSSTMKLLEKMTEAR